MNEHAHVVHIIPTLRFGGAERFVVDLINNSKKYRYSVITFFDDNPLAAELERDTRIFVLPKRGQLSLHLFSDLEKKLNEINPDIVHTHLFGGDVWGRISAKRLGLPVITTEHNFNYAEGFMKNSIKRFLKNKTDVYAACSESVKKYMKKLYSIKKEIHVIHYGIDIGRFKDVKNLKINKKINFLLLGRLVEQKGYDIALKVLAELRDYDWTLSVVGEGGQEKMLRDLSERLGIKDKITFLPPTHDIPAIFAQTDIMLVPSRWEGLGIVIMEAMAAGRLVVGSRVGGIPELITHGETGLLVESGDIEAWVGQLRDILEGKISVEKLASNGQRYAEEHFAKHTMVQKYEDVYQSLVR